MSKKIVWDDMSSRTYQAGVDRGVLYKYSGGDFVDGVAWNGLTSVLFKSARSNVTPLYAGDDVKLDFTYGYDEGSGTIKAYTYPDEFEEMLGHVEFVPGIYGRQQERLYFGLCYRTAIGDTANGAEAAYKLHLLYNLYVTDSDEEWATLNDSPSAYEFTFPFSSLPVDVYYDSRDPVLEVVVDSRKLSAEFLADLENILYGSETENPRMPDPDELIERYEVIPEIRAGYPHEYLFPRADLYPMRSILISEVTVGSETGIISIHSLLRGRLLAGTYRVLWDMDNAVLCTANRLYVLDTDNSIDMSPKTNVTESGVGFFDFIVAEDNTTFLIGWTENAVTPTANIQIAINKIA